MRMKVGAVYLTMEGAYRGGANHTHELHSDADADDHPNPGRETPRGS